MAGTIALKIANASQKKSSDSLGLRTKRGALRKNGVSADLVKRTEGILKLTKISFKFNSKTKNLNNAKNDLESQVKIFK